MAGSRLTQALGVRTMPHAIYGNGKMNAVRRKQLLLVAAGLSLAPIYAWAQKATKRYRVGVPAAEPKSLLDSLNELGYVDGRDVVFEVRNPEGRSELFDPLALDLVRLKVDVIVASNPNAVLSAKRATKTIPIVMMHTPDPVQLGFVASLARPEVNITGVTTLGVDLSIKQLELFKEAVPHVSRVALLWNPHDPWHSADRQGAAGSKWNLGT